MYDVPYFSIEHDQVQKSSGLNFAKFSGSGLYNGFEGVLTVFYGFGFDNLLKTHQVFGFHGF